MEGRVEVRVVAMSVSVSVRVTVTVTVIVPRTMPKSKRSMIYTIVMSATHIIHVRAHTMMMRMRVKDIVIARTSASAWRECINKLVEIVVTVVAATAAVATRVAS